MILSMTGFGSTIIELKNKKISIDIKSLNSKQADISTRIPPYYKEKELEIRKLLSSKLSRGKIDFYLSVEYIGKHIPKIINYDTVDFYYKQVVEFAKLKSIPVESNILSIIFRLPEIFQSETEQLDDKEWEVVLKGINNAIESCIEHRKNEGLEIKKDIIKKFKLILKYLKEIKQFEKERIEIIKVRLKENLNLFLSEFNSDKNRFEQEILYYLEKLDINEEKTRLKKHCDYFIDVIEKGKNQGKKLNFIAQEIGREINTLGSKAHHAEIQKTIIKMKDELEQIKEHLFNVL